MDKSIIERRVKNLEEEVAVLGRGKAAHESLSLINQTALGKIDGQLMSIAGDLDNFLATTFTDKKVSHGVRLTPGMSGLLNKPLADVMYKALQDAAIIHGAAFDAIKSTQGFQAITQGAAGRYRSRIGLDWSDGDPTDFYLVLEKEGTPETYLGRKTSYISEPAVPTQRGRSFLQRLGFKKTKS